MKRNSVIAMFCYISAAISARTPPCTSDFGMLPGHGPPDGQFSSLVLNSSLGCKLFIALELENCPSGGPCAMGRGVNPTFHSQMSTPDHPLCQIT